MEWFPNAPCASTLAVEDRPICGEHELERLAEVRARRTKRSPLRVHAGNFLNPSDVPFPALEERRGELMLHIPKLYHRLTQRARCGTVVAAHCHAEEVDMTAATITRAPKPIRASYTETLVRQRIRAELEFCGITRADIIVTRCDDLLNVYAARVRVHLGPTFEHPSTNVVYLMWRDRSGAERFRTIVHPKDVDNLYLDVRSVRTNGEVIIVSCIEHCGPGALKTETLERRIPIPGLWL